MQNKRKTSKFKTLLIWGAFFCFLAGVAYLVFFSCIFEIKKTEVEAEPSKYFTKEEVEQIAEDNYGEGFFYNLPFLGGFLPKANILLINSKNIEKKISQKISKIKKVDLKKDFIERSIKIMVWERERAGIYCTVEYQEKEVERIATTTAKVISEEGGSSATTTPKIEKTREIKNCYYIDKEGVVYKESPHLKGSLLLNIYSKESFNLNEQAVDSEAMAFIMEINKKIADLSAPDIGILKIKDFEIISQKGLAAETSRGWLIYFNPDYNLDLQLKSLKLLFEKEIIDSKNLEYIDLRIEERGYYKYES